MASKPKPYGFYVRPTGVPRKGPLEGSARAASVGKAVKQLPNDNLAPQDRVDSSPNPAVNSEVISAATTTSGSLAVSAASCRAADDDREPAIKLNNGTCHFLRLPAELRNEIYGLILGQGHEVKICPAGPQHTPPAISKVCQQIRNEVLSLYYGMHHFSANVDTSARVLRTWLEFLPRNGAVGKVVKHHLTIELSENRQFDREHLQWGHDYWDLVQAWSEMSMLLLDKGFMPASIAFMSPKVRDPTVPIEIARNYSDHGPWGRAPTGCPPADLLTGILEAAAAQCGLPLGYSVFTRLPTHELYRGLHISRPKPFKVPNQWINAKGELAMFPNRLQSEYIATPEELVRVSSISVEATHSFLSKYLIGKTGSADIEGVSMATKAKFDLVQSNDCTSTTQYWGWFVVPLQDGTKKPLQHREADAIRPTVEANWRNLHQR